MDKRRRFTFVALAVLFATCACNRSPSNSFAIGEGLRIVSLSPALTETAFALGLGTNVVAVSDYCHEPHSVERLPRVGTVFAPRYEDLLQAHPTIILAERIDGTKTAEIESLCAFRAYRWLTYQDVVDSTRAMGNHFGRAKQAEQLVAKYESELEIPLTDRPLRVLLALAQVPGQLAEVWYVRRNSIHGRALEAAGAANAIARDIVGPPRIALEEVVRLQPDAIIVLEQSEQMHVELLDDWKRLTGLLAIRSGRVAVVAAPEAQTPGPRIGRLVERLRQVVAAWGVSSNPNGTSSYRAARDVGSVP